MAPIAAPRVPGRVAAPVVRPSADPMWDRANNTIFGMVSPLLTRLAQQRVAAEDAARKTYGAHATALDSALQARAAPIDQSYATAVNSSAQTAEAVANRLNRQGSEASQGLAAKLAQINADPGASKALADTYAGASAAGFARDSNDVQNLISRRAEAGAYSQKLPGIGRMEASRDLATALAQMREQSNKQESDLLSGAQQNAFELWNQMRGEETEAKSAKEQALIKAISDAEERAWKEKQTLMALKATAMTKAEERAFDEQMKALDRKSKAEIAAANRNFQAWKVETGQNFTASQNEIKAKNNVKNTAPPTHPYLADGVTRNPNFNGTWVNGVPKPKAGKPKAPTVTPKYVLDSVWGSVSTDFVDNNQARWPMDIYKLIKGSPGAIDGILNRVINTQLSGHNIDPNSRQGKNIRQSTLRKLNGRKWKDNAGRVWTYEYGGK